jgi:hypothetical protein
MENSRRKRLIAIRNRKVAAAKKPGNGLSVEAKRKEDERKRAFQMKLKAAKKRREVARKKAVRASGDGTEKARLEELRAALRAENISTSELVELQSLVDFIDEGDVELLEAAGVPEFGAEGADKGSDDKGPKDKKPEDKDPKDKKPEDKKPEDKKTEDKKPDNTPPWKKKADAKKKASLASVRARIKSLKVKAAEVDENGTPVVGGAPEEDIEVVPPSKEDVAPPEPVVEVPEDTPPVDGGGSGGSISEDTASVLVKVNEKLDDINQREAVDKAVKTELEDIQQTLTTAAVKLKASAKIPVQASAKPLTQKEITTIVDFLGKVDAAYEKNMVGFEARASVSSKQEFDPIISRYRIAVDTANEKAHVTLEAYHNKKADSVAVKAAVREVKSAVDQWGAVTSMVDFFKKEASVTSASIDNTLKVVAFVQKMVEAEKLPVSAMSAQVREYLTLSPTEFKSVTATMNRMQGTPGTVEGTPKSMHPVQSGADAFSLEDAFEV